MKQFKLLSIAALIGTAGVANADPILINNDFGSTAIFSALGATNFDVVSTYTHGLGAGVVTDADDLIGLTLDVEDTGAGVIDTLDPLLGSIDTVGYGDDWTLGFSYTLNGTATFVDAALFPPAADGTLDGDNNGVIDFLDAIVPNFSSGTFEFFYNDLVGATTTKVMEFSLTNFEVSGPNVILSAEIDYGWYAGGDALVENFVTDGKSGQSFYDLSTQVNPVPITFRTDFNIDPNLVPTCVDADCEVLTRTTDINPSLTFKVPEPASLALFGLSLIGLGLSRRKA